MKVTASPVKKNTTLRIILLFLMLIALSGAVVKAQSPAVTPTPVPAATCSHQHNHRHDPAHGETDSQTLTQTTTCPNSDFSQGTFAYWKGAYGTFNNPSQNIGFQSVPPNERHLIIPGPGANDPYGFTIPSTVTLTTVFPGEAYSARLGNDISGAQAEQLSYDITIGPDNDFFIYRYAVVLNDNGHQPNQQPSFEIDIIDQATGLQFDPVCGYYYVYAQPNLPDWHTSPIQKYNAPIRWKDWTTVGLAFDESDYGRALTIVFTTKDCSPSGHFGYAYISAFCTSLTVTFQGCEGSNQVTMTGPPGFADYEWTGPYCGTCSPTVVGTTQSITINNANTGDEYRLKLISFYNYPNCIIQKVSSTVAFTHVYPGFYANINCIANPSTFIDTSVINQNATDVRIWDFGDGSPPLTTTSATATHVFATAGTYTVTLTRSTTDPCTATCSSTVTVSSIPPVVTNPTMNKSICSGTTVNIPLEFSQPSTTGTWTRTVVSGTATITTNPPSQTGSLINDLIINTGTTTATVVYSIIPHIGACYGPAATYTVTVTPVAHLANAITSKAICSLENAGIILQPEFSGGTFSWTATVTSGSVTISNPTTPPGTTINDQLINTGAGNGVVTYNLLPYFNGCAGQPATYSVTVYPLPAPEITGEASVCIGVTGKIYLTQSGKQNYQWTIPPEATVTAGGTSSSNSVTLTWNSLGYHGISVNFTEPATMCTAAQATTFSITVNPLPEPLLSGESTVCHNAPGKTYATQPGKVNYSWTVPPQATVTSGGTPADHQVTVTWNTVGTHLIAVNYADPGTFCTAVSPATFTVTVNPLPTAVVSGTTNVCKDATPPEITFTGGNSTPPYTFTYNINGGPDMTVSTISGNSVTVAVPTGTPGIFNYNLLAVQDASSTTCSQTQSGTAVVTVNPLPTATIIGTTAVCRNAPQPLITFTGGSSTPPYTFTYNINGGPDQQVTTVSGNSATISVPTGVDGTYTYHLTGVQDGSSTACSQPQTGSAVITVNPLPTATISGTTQVCRNGVPPLVTLTGASATPPYTFTYNINGGPDQTVSTTSGNSVTVEAPTGADGVFSYNLVSVQDGSITLCSQLQTGSAVITVNPLPTATIAGTTAVCLNAPQPLITFTGASAMPPYTFTYNINGGPDLQVTTTSGNSATVAVPTNVAGTFTYNLTSVRDGSLTQCLQAQTGEATVTVNPLPTATVAGTTTVCRNALSPLIIFTGESATPPYTFTYRINGGPDQFVTSTSGNSATVAVPTDVAGTFTYSLVGVRDGSSTSCYQGQTGNAVVTVNPLPTAAVTGTTAVCKDSPSPFITFTGGSATPPYTFTYNINGGPDLQVTTVTGNSVTVSVPTNIPGIYTYNLLGVRDASSVTCSQAQTGTATVTVHALPVPTITGPGANCLNTTNTYQTENGNGITGYTWNLLSGGTIINQNTFEPTVTWNAIGIHIITVNYIDANGCTAASPTQKQVTINTLPVPTITGANALCTGDTRTYNTETGAVSYSWTYPASGITLLAGGSTSDDFITIRWDTPSTYNITVNYVIGTGCTAPSPTPFTITVNPPPNPAITGPNPVCGLLPQVYAVNPVVAGHQYLWSVTGGTIQSGMNASQVNILWGNTLPAEINLTETIVYPGVSCSAQAPVFQVTLNPWPVAAGAITGLNSVCRDWTNVIYQVEPVLNSTSYLWNYSGTGASVVNNGNSISVSFSPTATSGFFTVAGVNNCGTGPVSPSLQVDVHAPLTLSFTPCFDLVTTPDAKKFMLRGGRPYLAGQGEYSGNRVSYNPVTGNYEFDPSGAPAGTYPISYRYTNTYGCEAQAPPANISVVNNAFSCGGMLTDVRDGKEYRTALISGRCWMTDNLNYGTIVSTPGPPQTDNCVPEKYCTPDDANCTKYGGLYQWDEAMNYTTLPGGKGICPPGWHIPTESEWQQMIDNLIAGVGAPEANALAGSTLKDPLPASGFKALLGGLYFLNNTWAYGSGPFTSTQYWTSTPIGADHALSRGLNVYNPSISRYERSRANAFSVRCLRD